MSKPALHHHFPRARGRAFLGLFSVLLMGTALITAAPRGASATQSASATQAERVAVGDEAIDFTMQSIDGETYRLSDLRGEKNAIIIFFRGAW